jgi:galactose-6-phosphate isomerase
MGMDMRDGVLSPELLSSFAVQRREQNDNNYGRAQNTSLWTIPGRGVITATSPDQLVRLPEEQHMSKTIEIVTTFGLQGPSNGLCPDLVFWHGNEYVVQIIDDWSNYGPGFVHAVCTSMDSMDNQPEVRGIGQP